MQIKVITPSDLLWNKAKEYARHSSWSAGRFLAKSMDNGAFSEWERVIVAFEGDEIRGYCTVTKTDCIPDVEYTPYIGFVFVGEEYRGKRISQKMIEFAMKYLKTVGFESVYLVSDHENLYEKYGFQVIDKKTAFWGREEKIYWQAL